MNIYEKMSAITMEISAVAKNLEVGFGANKYKAVGEADVLASVKPIEAKYKVYSFPYSREIVESGVLTTIKKDGSESKQQFLRISTVYRFVDMEEPSSYIDITTYGDGVDSQDKAPGKAMTYGDKYALLKAYKIITGDDPDQNYSEELKSKAEKPKPKTQKEKAKAAYPPREEMMAVILTQWDEKKILDGYGVGKLADVTDEQVMVMYAKAVSIKQQRDALDKKES